jgi:pilus assembly protein Flp/PilA
MRTLISAFLRDETAATAIEYGLMSAGIAVAIIAILASLGSKLTATFNLLVAALK